MKSDGIMEASRLRSQFDTLAQSVVSITKCKYISTALTCFFFLNKWMLYLSNFDIYNFYFNFTTLVVVIH